MTRFSRLRRTTEFNSNRLLILSQKLHELVRFTVTRCAIGPEKTNRFENLVFGGKMDPKVRCSPIFSFGMIRPISVITVPIIANSDFVNSQTVTRSAIGTEKPRRFQTTRIERCFYQKVQCSPIFSFPLIMRFWVFSMVKLKYSSPHLASETAIKRISSVC